MNTKYSITDFGAVADGITMNTAAINAAVAACAEAGGGTVIVPAGTFVTGTVWLKSHVELRLEHGAVLKASGSFDDYNAEDAYPQNASCADEEWVGAHLIIAHECEDVAVTGSGTIDGNVWAFISESDTRSGISSRYSWFRGFLRNNRPGQAVCFIECRNVRVEGITLRDLPCWAVFFHGCDYVAVRGVSVFNKPYIANTDGLDIDSCRYVTVSDCNIDTGDDAIALRCSKRRLKDQDRACEFVTITNCVLASCSDVFRVGVGNGELRHIRVSNITAHRGHALVDFCVEWSTVSHTPVTDVDFRGVSSSGVMRAFVCGTKDTPVRRVTLSDFRCETQATSVFCADTPGIISDITLRDIEIVPQYDPDLTEENRRRRGEYAVRLEGIDGLVCENVTVTADERTEKQWTGMMKVE